jgi:NAD(P)-dependent dehydrogenase (short-subunit alcohol dehydrogenase family)
MLTLSDLVFDTEFAGALTANRNPEAETINDPRFIPAKRYGGESEMAGTVLYLASRAGSFVNGLAFVTDGGKLSISQSSY